jgi:hypothetical protein
MELPAIVERFAVDFESLPEFEPGLGSLRMSITPVTLVPAVVVFGMALSDGSVELVSIEIDLP